MVAKEQNTTTTDPIEPEIDPLAALNFETVYEGIGVTWDFKTKPVLIGVYMRKETTDVLKYGSKTEMEPRTVYTIKTSSDDLAAVWDSFSLRRAFSDIETGKVVRITYNGKDEIEGTDKEVKDFKVEVAK